MADWINDMQARTACSLPPAFAADSNCSSQDSNKQAILLLAFGVCCSE
jgi:hypothetical protein